MIKAIKLKNETHRLGDYIREVNIRNRELKVTNLVGLTIDKAFIPSVANVIGTDLSNYKVICREQFACSLMQVSRDGKMPVAMFEEDEAIMSPAYPMFEAIDKSKLLPQYLMMWFSRKEFDREASYYAVGGVRGSLEWSDFCNMQLPVPSIERQREIVSEYETLTRRIRLNNQMIEKLEATAQALYHKTFVAGIDKQNLPQGWHLATLGEIVECHDSKRRPIAGYDREKMDTSKKTYPYYGAAALMDYVDDYIFDGEYILMGEDGTVINEDNTPVVQYVRGRFWVNNHAHILKGKNGFDENFLYLIFKNADVHELVTGGVQAKINQENMMKIPVTIPPQHVLEGIKEQECPVFHAIYLKQQENKKLTELQSLLLAKMGKFDI